MLCRKCGKQIDKKNKFCAACGASVADAVPRNAKSAKKRQIRRYHHLNVVPGDHPFKDGFEITVSQFSSLLGTTYLSYILIALAILFTLFVPFVGIAFSFIISTALTRADIEATSAREANHKLLFSLFGKGAWRIIGANSIVALYLFLWCLIPIAGPIITIRKAYSYRFVPYIMASNPNVSAIASVEISKQMTYGLKGRMFRADFLFALILLAINALLVLLCFIPVVNIVAIGVAIFLDMSAPVFLLSYQATFFPTTGLKCAPPRRKKQKEGAAKPTAENAPEEQTAKENAEVVVKSNDDTEKLPEEAVSAESAETESNAANGVETESNAANGAEPAENSTATV